MIRHFLQLVIASLIVLGGETLFASSWINIDLIRKNAVPIRRMMDDVVVLPRSNRVKVGDLVVIVRIKDDDVEVIARGSAENVQDNEILVLLENKSISKFPKPKDLVVSLSRLKPVNLDEPIMHQEPNLQTETPEPYEPGYILFEMGPYQGHFESQSPNNANMYKKYDFKNMETHFLWYVDFLWRYGIEYQSSSGDIPVKGYNREEMPTTSSETRFALHYRFLPLWKELRPTLKVISFSSEFKTKNDDEYVLSSTASGIGLGVRFHYLFNDDLFKTTKGFGWSFNKAYFDLNYFPQYSVSDSGVSRGASSSGSLMELRAGATFLFYVNAIPWLKRYSLDLSAGMNQSEVAFSGAVKNAADGVYDIPAGQTYKESQSFIKVMIGLRMDDFISKLMKPR